MSICVISANRLCNSCLHLPAVSLGTKVCGLSAVEVNDLCTICAQNNNIYVNFLDPKAPNSGLIIKQIQQNSPWHKSGCGRNIYEKV